MSRQPSDEPYAKATKLWFRLPTEVRQKILTTVIEHILAEYVTKERAGKAYQQLYDAGRDARRNALRANDKIAASMDVNGLLDNWQEVMPDLHQQAEHLGDFATIGEEQDLMTSLSMFQRVLNVARAQAVVSLREVRERELQRILREYPKAAEGRLVMSQSFRDSYSAMLGPEVWSIDIKLNWVKYLQEELAHRTMACMATQRQ